MATVALRQPLLNRVSWGGLFAGFFFGFGIWLLLLALGAGIGFAAFNPSDVGQWQGLGIGVGIWGVICGIIAMFVGAWLAARLGLSETRLAGMLHGAALWGFMIVTGLWIAAMAVMRTAGTAAEAMGSAAQGAAQMGAQSPQMQQHMMQRGEQAREQVQGLRQQTEERKGEAAGTAKKFGTASSWAFFIYAILTLVAAVLGGSAGVPKERLITPQEERVPAPGAPLTPQRA